MNSVKSAHYCKKFDLFSNKGSFTLGINEIKNSKH